MGRQRSFQSVESEGDIKCPECGSKDVIKKDSEIYCKKCGYVID